MNKLEIIKQAFIDNGWDIGTKHNQLPTEILFNKGECNFDINLNAGRGTDDRYFTAEYYKYDTYRLIIHESICVVNNDLFCKFIEYRTGFKINYEGDE